MNDPLGIVLFDQFNHLQFYDLINLNGRKYELLHVAENPAWHDDPRSNPKFMLAKGAGIYPLVRDFIDTRDLDDDVELVPPHHKSFNQLFLDLHVETVYEHQRLAQYGDRFAVLARAELLESVLQEGFVSIRDECGVSRDTFVVEVACASTRRFWVDVTDTWMGITRRYENPVGGRSTCFGADAVSFRNSCP